MTLAEGTSVSTRGYIHGSLRLVSDDSKVLILASLKFHVLAKLSFDIILGLHTLRKYNLISHFASIFSDGDCLMVHNCRSCRQCLPGAFQRESSTLSAGISTHAEFPLKTPSDDTLGYPRHGTGRSVDGYDGEVNQAHNRRW